jgi:uncharacterized Zn finger protein
VSRWGDRGWYKAPDKKPPPAHGIKMKQAGTTWWGQRWIQALEHVLRGDAGRLSRGRTYARAGRTHDLVVSGGTVAAKVTGSRSTPYRITIQIAQLPATAWAKAIAGMAAQAQFAAELLAGQMPQQIADVFRDAGTHLFPAQRADLVTSCTCPDWGDPCKHVAATHYVLGEALDRDPFLLFELRGRTKAQVLDALRSARTGEAPGKPSRGQAASAATIAVPEVPKVSLGVLEAADYDRPREALPTLQLSFNEPGTHGAVLLQLGAPAAWSGDGSPAELLAPLVRAAAARARSIAMAEPEPEPEPDAAIDAVVPTTARGTKPRAAATRSIRTPPGSPATPAMRPSRAPLVSAIKADTRPPRTPTVSAIKADARPIPKPPRTTAGSATATAARPARTATTSKRMPRPIAPAPTTTPRKPADRGPTRPGR